MISPTARTLSLLREREWPADIVERWVPGKKIRKDLFGCFDIVALDTQPGVIGIQVTSDNGGNVSARTLKIKRSPLAIAWLAAGNRIVVHGWGKRGKAGTIKRWTLREVPVTLETLEAV